MILTQRAVGLRLLVVGCGRVALASPGGLLERQTLRRNPHFNEVAG